MPGQDYGEDNPSRGPAVGQDGEATSCLDPGGKVSTSEQRASGQASSSWKNKPRHGNINCFSDTPSWKLGNPHNMCCLNSVVSIMLWMQIFSGHDPVLCFFIGMVFWHNGPDSIIVNKGKYFR